jgi:hypothetical protein
MLLPGLLFLEVAQDGLGCEAGERSIVGGESFGVDIGRRPVELILDVHRRHFVLF